MCFSNVRCPRGFKTTTRYRRRLPQETIILQPRKGLKRKLLPDKEPKCWLEGKTCIDGPYTSHFDVHCWMVVQRASHLNNNIKAFILLLLLSSSYSPLIQLPICGPYNYITLHMLQEESSRKLFDFALADICLPRLIGPKWQKSVTNTVWVPEW